MRSISIGFFSFTNYFKLTSYTIIVNLHIKTNISCGNVFLRINFCKIYMPLLLSLVRQKELTTVHNKNIIIIIEKQQCQTLDSKLIRFNYQLLLRVKRCFYSNLFLDQRTPNLLFKFWKTYLILAPAFLTFNY